MLGSVAQLDTCGQFTGQEAHWVKAEDPADEIRKIKNGLAYVTVNKVFFVLGLFSGII